MNNRVDFRRIYTESVKADFEALIKLLNTDPLLPIITRQKYYSLFINRYDKLYNTGLKRVNEELNRKFPRVKTPANSTEPSAVQEEISPADRHHRIQVDVAYELATDFYYELKIPEENKNMFINSIAYCLLCRFKCIPDPMDHQIRKGIAGEQ